MTGIEFFLAERTLSPCDGESEDPNNLTCHPQAIEGRELVLLYCGSDMADAGGASEKIDQKKGRQRPREDP